jgi:hypothetical protein
MSIFNLPSPPQLPSLPELPFDFSLPVKGATESRSKYALRVCLRVSALAIMVISCVAPIIFAATSKTIYKWSIDG